MSHKNQEIVKAPAALDGFPPLLEALRKVIAEGRRQVLRSVDTVQVQTYWQVGRHIVEFEQRGASRAAYGKRLLADLAESLTREFGKGFDASNLRYMRLFYQTFPNCDALRHKLSWTHYRLLLRVDSPEAQLRSDNLEALKTHKKGLMQQLFPAAKEVEA